MPSSGYGDHYLSIVYLGYRSDRSAPAVLSRIHDPGKWLGLHLTTVSRPALAVWFKKVRGFIHLSRAYAVQQVEHTHIGRRLQLLGWRVTPLQICDGRQWSNKIRSSHCSVQSKHAAEYVYIHVPEAVHECANRPEWRYSHWSCSRSCWVVKSRVLGFLHRGSSNTM